MPSREMERKALPFFVTKVDGDQGIVEAIVNVFGIIDEGDDVITLGAFTKTLTERGRKVRVLNAHNKWSIDDVIGKPLAMREVGRDELPMEVLTKYPEATGGLLTVTQYALSTPNGATAFALIRDGYVDEYSIGFEPIVVDYVKVANKTVRYIREVRMWEYSPVVWGMNPATATVGVKSDMNKLIHMVLGDEKAGRVLSGANANRIRAAFDELYAVLNQAGLMDDGGETDYEMPVDEEMSKSAEDMPLEVSIEHTGVPAEPSAQDAKSLTDERERLLKIIRDNSEGGLA